MILKRVRTAALDGGPEGCQTFYLFTTINFLEDCLVLRYIFSGAILLFIPILSEIFRYAFKT